MNPGMLQFMSRQLPVTPPTPPTNQIMPGLRAQLNRGVGTDPYKGAANTKQTAPRDVIGRRYQQGADDFGGIYGQGATMANPMGPALPPIEMYQ